MILGLENQLLKILFYVSQNPGFSLLPTTFSKIQQKKVINVVMPSYA